jgi:hypothetical protein
MAPRKVAIAGLHEGLLWHVRNTAEGKLDVQEDRM